MSTNRLSVKDIHRRKIVIDARGKILGRLATEVATLLMGKNKPQYVPYLDTGDYVVVTNASKVKITGKKLSQKKYVWHSGYPGGLRVEGYDKLIQRRPEYIIEHAVVGMLPKNRLGRQMFKKLEVFATHPDGEQQNVQK
jgi:large subunit ribosomal protein L13